MIQEYQLRVLPQTAANEQRLIAYIAKEKGLDARTIRATRVLKRSIDARQRDGRFGMIFNRTWGAPYDPHAFMSHMRVPSHADYQAQLGLAATAFPAGPAWQSAARPVPDRG